TTPRTAPVQVLGGISTATAVTAGDLHSCALLSNKMAKCWGRNNLGQLGNGTGTVYGTSYSTTPTDVVDLTGAGLLAAGGTSREAGSSTQNGRRLNSPRLIGS